MNTSPSTMLIKNAITAKCRRCGTTARNPKNWTFTFRRHPISALSGKIEWIPILYCETCATVLGVESNLKEILKSDHC